MLNAYPVLVSLLALVYLLGIVSDRVADVVFDKCFSDQLRKQFFSQKRDYQEARRLVIDSSDRLQTCTSMVALGFVFAVAGRNAVLIAVCLNVFLQARCSETQWFRTCRTMGDFRMLCAVIRLLVVLAAVVPDEYMKIRENAEFLSQRIHRPRMRTLPEVDESWGFVLLAIRAVGPFAFRF